MADNGSYVGEQGAGDSASQDAVDAKPDRSSFVPSIFKYVSFLAVSFLAGLFRGPGLLCLAMPPPPPPTHREGDPSGEGVYAMPGRFAQDSAVSG